MPAKRSKTRPALPQLTVTSEPRPNYFIDRSLEDGEGPDLRRRTGPMARFESLEGLLYDNFDDFDDEGVDEDYEDYEDYYETDTDEYDEGTDFSSDFDDEDFGRNVFNYNLVMPFRLAMQSLMGRDWVDTLLDSESEIDSDGFSAWLTQTPEITFVFNVRLYLQALKRTCRDPIIQARIESFCLFLDTLQGDTDQLTRACEDFRSEMAEALGRPLPDFPVLDESTSLTSLKSRGLSTSEFNRLARHRYRGQTQREKRLNEQPHKCCICMAELEVDEELILLEGCAHRFHSGCLEAWLRRSNQCPICRSKVILPSQVIN